MTTEQQQRDPAERRSRRANPDLFVPHWLIFLIGLPFAGTVLWTLSHYPHTAHDLVRFDWPADPAALSRIAVLDGASTVIATAAAVAYGVKVAGRHPLVV